LDLQNHDLQEDQDEQVQDLASSGLQVVEVLKSTGVDRHKREVNALHEEEVQAIVELPVRMGAVVLDNLRNPNDAKDEEDVVRRRDDLRPVNQERDPQAVQRVLRKSLEVSVHLQAEHVERDVVVTEIHSHQCQQRNQLNKELLVEEAKYHN